MTRLSPTTLDRLPSGVRIPAYRRTECPIGIVHLGVGAFHRAHQAVYTDEVLERGGGGAWAIAGVSLRRPLVRDALDPQDGLYTLIERGGGGDSRRVIGALRDVLFAPADPDTVLARLVAPSTRVVSLTVTEKGYCRDPAGGALQRDHPDVVHDLNDPGHPRGVLGYLVEALARRRAAGVAPFTVLCCDNLPNNGRSLRGVTLEFAAALDVPLATWIEREVPFPCTMVDRIVPATTAKDRAEFEAATGLHDAAPVIAEPFTQWVIEDRFAAGRPDWESAGALLVPDVAPYEHMKLRLLNGPHSALAYLGYLGGCEYIGDCMHNPLLSLYAERLMRDEIAPTIAPPPGYDLQAYIGELLARFANPALHHRTWQIAMDGSQKLPQRLLDTVRERIARGQSVALLALAVGAWMRYVSGIDEHGAPIEVRDPLAAELRNRARRGMHDPNALVDALLGERPVFGEDLAVDPQWRAALRRAATRLYTHGVLGAVKRLLATRETTP